MRQILLFVSVMVIFSVWYIYAIEPNCVRSVIHDVDGASNNLISSDYTDGLGRTIQSKLKLSGGSARVVSTFYDIAGRLRLTTKPFKDDAANAADIFTPGDFTYINSILNNSENYYNYIKLSGTTASAYSEVTYYDDPLSRVKRSGAPGVDYNIESGHFTCSWSFGVKKNATEEEISFQTVIVRSGIETPVNVKVKLLNGFIDGLIPVTVTVPAVTSSEILDGFYDYLIKTPIANSDYTLIVETDPDGRLTQSLKNPFGEVEFTRADNGTEKIIAQYTYDIMGNISREIAPKKADGTDLLGDSKYEYNSLGELVQRESPDGTIEKMDYDDAGNIITRGIYRRNGITEVLDIEYRYDYDDLGRLICISTPYMYGGYIHLLEYYYDNADLIKNIADEYGIPVEAYSNLENTNGKLVAEVACNRPFGVRFYTGKTSYVVDVYSYFPEGHIKTKYKVIPGLPLQTIKYEYDVHGKNSAEEFTAATIVSKKYYKYDEYGNLEAIAHGTPSNDVLMYDYDPQGKLKSKELSLLSGSKTVSYSYNIRDWFESSSFNGVNRFSQILDYIDNGTTTSFSGNVQVSQVSYENQLGDTKVYKQRYTYDGVNRLSAIDSKDLAGNPQFTGAYTYDNAGRFNSKQEQSSNNDAYEYYKDNQRATNRLKKAKTIGDGLYIFDSRGNLIIDKEKKMHIAYDWRNMPIKFSFFNDLPVGEKTSTEKIRPDDYGTITINDSRYINREPTYYVDWLCEKGEITLQSSVQILYDASGKRVLKIAK